MDESIQRNVLAITQLGRSRAEALGFFRVALGLHYLAGVMTREQLDFKKIDREYNRFIYQAIGKGHSITSVLQFLSGENVLPVLESARFADAFRRHCPEVPFDSLPFLLSLNLGVAKSLSGIPVAGPVADWIARQKGGADFLADLL